MLNILKSLRYFVFVVFVICNAIITSVAVWNLSIVQTVTGSAYSVMAQQIDSYLIFVGAAGLLLIFPIIFYELYGKNTFIGRVWFELLWVGLFWLMELAGAAVLTAQSSSQTCDTNLEVPSISPSSSSLESPCASSQVLQAFTWVVAILLLGYFTLLSILTIVKRKDDPTIWHCSVRHFPLMHAQNALKSVPTSPSMAHFRAQSPPSIAAPRPRHLAALREAIFSYRSGLSPEYEIEYYQTPTVTQNPRPADMEENRPMPWVTTPAPVLAPLQPLRQKDHPGQPRVPQPAQLSSEIRRLPPSPPPLGDWPRLDATKRPRTKRKPLPQPEPEPQPQRRPEPEPQHQPQAQSPPQHHRRRPSALPRPPSQDRRTSQSQSQYQWQSLSSPQQASQPQTLARQQSQRNPLPEPLQPRTHVRRDSVSQPYTFDAPALAAALQPLASPPVSSSWRSKPGGPRRRSSSIDNRRPPGLDLSKISSFRSPGFNQ